MATANTHIQNSNRTNLNVFSYIDYNKPIECNKDFRTTGVAMQNYKDIPVKMKLFQQDPCKVLGNKEMKYDYKSESKAAYNWKLDDGNNLPKANLPWNNRRLKFIPTSADKMGLSPKALNEYETTYKNDYDRKPLPVRETIPEKAINQFFGNFEKTTTTIDPDKPGYSKNMELLATTSMITHAPFSDVRRNGIGSKDYITVWNWLGISPQSQNADNKEKSLTKGPKLNERSVRPIPCTVKNVPNNGLISEFKSNFTKPELHVKFDTRFIENQAKIYPFSEFSTDKPESSMYGSGMRTEKFLNTKKFNTFYKNSTLSEVQV